MLRAIHSGTGLRVAPEQDYLPANAIVDKFVGPEKLIELVHQHLQSAQAV